MNITRENIHTFYILGFLAWNCILVLYFLWYIDRPKKEKYTKSDLIEYGKRQVDITMDSIKKQSHIPNDISVEDYAVYVKVHNAFVVANRAAKAEQEYTSKKEAIKLLIDTVNKKVKN